VQEGESQKEREQKAMCLCFTHIYYLLVSDKREIVMLERYEEFRLFWGDSHTNVHGEDVEFPALTRKRLRRTMMAASEHLDFFPIAYYPFESYYDKGFRIHSYGSRDRFLKDWKLVQETVAEANNPREFVTFLGYEWHGNRRRYGDHNVYYLRDDEPLDCSETIQELYDSLRRTDAIAVPHHTAYQVRQRGKDWDFFDEELSPLVEIYSSHGSSEGGDTPYPLDRIPQMGPGTSGGTVQDGLNRGHKFGIIASGDNQRDYPGEWGNGLMAVFARDLTRDSLWEAFKKRRVYGVTGDRILLYFSMNGHIMGKVFNSKTPANISVEAFGGHAIDRIEIIRNGRVIHTHCHPERWNIPTGDGIIRAKLRMQCGWGPEGVYGFKEIGSKAWKGSLRLSEGRIVTVEPCFTYFGQQVKRVSRTRYDFILTTQPRIPSSALTARHHRSNSQGAIFEIEANLGSQITIEADSVSLNFSLEDALQNERLIALMEEAKTTIRKQFGLDPEQVENPDVYWNNAWKNKIYRAIPYEGYHVKFSYTDENPREGENYYYVRVTQLNGQMAWSSPIWMRYRPKT